MVVWRHSRRRNTTHSHAVHPHGLLNLVSHQHYQPTSTTNTNEKQQNGPDPPYNSPQLDLILQRELPHLDPIQHLAYVRFPLRRPGLHARHLLETQELPDEPPLLIRLHAARSICH